MNKEELIETLSVQNNELKEQSNNIKDQNTILLPKIKYLETKQKQAEEHENKRIALREERKKKENLYAAPFSLMSFYMR